MIRKNSLKNKVIMIFSGLSIISMLFLISLNILINKNPILIRDSISGVQIQSNSESWNLEWNEATSGKRIAFDSEENIIVGCRDYPGFSLVKYNNSGVKLWSTGYWAIWDFYHLEDIVIDASDNIYVVGLTSGEIVGWKPHFFVIKYNQSGVFEWKDIVIIGEYCFPHAVACDSYGDIYLVVSAKNYFGKWSIHLIKYNISSGGWWSSWGGFNEDWGVDIAVDSLDNIYLLGVTNNTSGGDYDLLLLKYNNSGDILWNVTWGGVNNDYGSKILIDSSQQINLLGSTEINGSSNSFVLKYNDSGVLFWNKTFLEKIYNNFALNSSDDYYFIHNGEYFEGVGTDIYLAKYNNSGNFKSDLIWGGIFDDSCNDIAIDSLDNIYLTGYARDKMILVKNPEDKTSYSPPGIFSLIVNTTEIGINESFILTWTNSRNADNYSIYICEDYFRDIENPAILYEEGIINNNFTVSELSNGVYFFLVASFNKNGYTVSNYVTIIVSDKIDTSQGIPIEFYYLLSIFIGIGIVYVVTLSLISRRIFRSD